MIRALFYGFMLAATLWNVIFALHSVVQGDLLRAFTSALGTYIGWTVLRDMRQ